jgi:hypothetical protein
VRALTLYELAEVAGGQQVSPSDLACAAGIERALRLSVVAPGGRRASLPMSEEAMVAALATRDACDRSPLAQALARANELARDVPRRRR